MPRAIPTKHLRSPDNPRVRLRPTLKHDRVSFNHHDDREVALAHHADNLTGAGPATKGRDVGLLSGLHVRALPRFAPERTEDRHVAVLLKPRLQPIQVVR